jgi:mono/diheme cytochrome c family protein
MRGKLKRMFVPGMFLWLSAAATSGQSPSAASLAMRGKVLVGDLGCASCHSELRFGITLRDRTPDLSSAGLRYRPAWLFEFLQHPVKIRQHLGRARMPGFHLTEKEAVALVAFLETQRTISGQWPPLPDAIVKQAGARSDQISRQQVQAELSNGLLCLTCHKFDGKGGNLGIELTTVAYRLQPGWIRQYLAAPAMFGVAPAVMPPQFYRLIADGKTLREMIPNAAGRINRLAEYLCSLDPSARETLEGKYAAAKATSSEANAALGQTLFTALNCAACHRHSSVRPHAQPGAPDLTREGWRVNQAWLSGYLKHPQPLRPFGYHPGDGSRMPDFRLSDEEVVEIGAFLVAQREGSETFVTGFHAEPLSAFSQNKAKLLLTEKLSCLGCHQLGDQGGRIGPSLSGAGSRLQPSYVYGVIHNPRAVAPHSIMPRVPLTEETARLIANYLVQQTNSLPAARYLSLVEHAPLPLNDSPLNAPGIRHTYLKHCAACHGPEGKGNGYNARFLPVKPTAHADAAYLSTRPDDTLYDGIHAGGYILNKNHLMPPWGETLQPKEIQELVRYLRTLCQCEGPQWSLDGPKQP